MPSRNGPPLILKGYKMKFEFFGWLTKGALNVSLLDRLVMVGEITAVLVVVCVPLAILEVRNKRRSRRIR